MNVFLAKITKKRENFCIYQKYVYFCTRLTAIRSDSLAQQVEHNTFNVGVLGSSPRRITEEKRKCSDNLRQSSLNQWFKELFSYPLATEKRPQKATL